MFVRCDARVSMIVAATFDDQYVGCYRDTKEARAMTGGYIFHWQMSLGYCQQHCLKTTATYFGVEV